MSILLHVDRLQPPRRQFYFPRALSRICPEVEGANPDGKSSLSTVFRESMRIGSARSLDSP